MGGGDTYWIFALNNILKTDYIIYLKYKYDCLDISYFLLLSIFMFDSQISHN